MVSRVEIEPLRTIAFGGISGAYASVGIPFDHDIRMIRAINNTDGDMILSDDTGVAAGKLFVPANTLVLWDFQANMNPRTDDKYVKAINTQISIKQSTAATTGDFYLECIY